MDRMTQLEEMAKEHGGVLKTSMAVSAGISKPTFALFLRKYGYQQVSAGIYCAPDAWLDELYLLQLRCPKTIFSHETALFLYDLTDREPLAPSVTAKTGYNPSHLTKAGVKVYTVKSELFELGKTTRTTPFGNTVATYNPERTICDIVRSRHSIDTQVFQDALKQYTRRRDKNLRQLMDYARQFRVERILTPYLEVLL